VRVVYVLTMKDYNYESLSLCMHSDNANVHHDSDNNYHHHK